MSYWLGYGAIRNNHTKLSQNIIHVYVALEEAAGFVVQIFLLRLWFWNNLHFRKSSICTWVCSKNLISPERHCPLCEKMTWALRVPLLFYSFTILMSHHHLGLCVCLSGWSFSMGSAYQFHSWRVFVVVCALPCVSAVVALTFMPESPRFYLEVWETLQVAPSCLLMSTPTDAKEL